MGDTRKISFEVSSTDLTIPLGLEVWLDENKLIDIAQVQLQEITLKIPNSPSDRNLKFIIKNKLPEHTQIDSDGNIVKDARLTIKNLVFDEVPIGHLFLELAEYIHDSNGTQNLTSHKFFGEGGCNGTVSLKFTTPLYVWLLENL